MGSQGPLLADYHKHLLLLGPDVRDSKRPPESMPPSIGHHAEWVNACKTGARTSCPFSYSGPLTEANHLGNVAFRSGKRLEWDAAAMKIPNAPEAEKYIEREYRPGWELEKLA